MASDEIIIDGRDLMRSVRLGVRMPRAFGLRITLATWLFQLAGWVSGTTVTVEVDGEDADKPVAFTDVHLRGEPANWTPAPAASGTKGPPPLKED